MSTTNWVTVTNTPILNFTNLQQEVALSPPAATRFYRLISR
jgi:hypothetical protein